MWYNDITSELMYPENQQLVYNFLFKIEIQNRKIHVNVLQLFLKLYSIL